MPPMHNTRRMFAGRRVTFHKPLKVGDMIERVSTIRQVEPKTGRTGSFTLVTVVHELSAGSGVAVTEEQDLVYREAVAEAGGRQAGAAGQGPAGDREGRTWTVPWTPDTPHAVPLFGADLQRAPHPLRSAVHPREGGLSRRWW